MLQQYTFVTVAHAIDYGLLKLQAKSMAIYCPPSLVREILVVENFDQGAEMDWRSALLAAYGPLASLVRFISARDLAQMPLSSSGWWTQQVAKLAVAQTIQSERYVILDAKNQLVQPLTAGFLEAADGRPRLNGYSFENHPLQDALIRTLFYLGVDATPFIPKFARTSTPYTMITQVAKDVVSYVEQKDGPPFGEAFLTAKLTEFFLYGGYLAKSGSLWTTYDMSQPHCAQIWGHSATEEGCQDVITRAAKAGACPFMAVHRVALKEMTVIPRVIVGEFWKEQGLFNTVEDAVRFTLDPNSF